MTRWRTTVSIQDGQPSDVRQPTRPETFHSVFLRKQILPPCRGQPGRLLAPCRGQCQPNPTQPIRTAHARDGRRTNQTSVLLKAPSPDRCLPSYPSPPAYPSRGACCSRFFAVRGAGDHARCGHPKTRGRHAGAASPIRNALAPAGNNTGAGRLRRVLNVPLLHHRDKKDSLPPHRSSLADYNSHLPSSNLLP
jgi:hypothetical protein